MKHIIVLILLVCPLHELVAQSDSAKSSGSNEKFYMVDVMPEFPGGEAGCIKYLEENIKYPEEAKKKKVEGIVYVRFEINETGKVQNVSVIKGKPELNDEAIRVIKMMSDWKPGSQSGKNVTVEYKMPINFRL